MKVNGPPTAALVHAISTAASSRQSASKAVPKRPQSDAHTPHQPHLVFQFVLALISIASVAAFAPAPVARSSVALNAKSTALPFLECPENVLAPIPISYSVAPPTGRRPYR